MSKKLFFLIFIIVILFLFLHNKIYSEKHIKVGSSLPKSGIMKNWGNSVIIGANAYFKYANDNKLLKDKKIELITYDDKYEPELTIKNLKKLIEKDDIFALFGFVGTPTIKNILPTIDDENIPFFAPFTGASFLRNKQKTNLINFRSSYKEEIENIINYLDSKKLKNIAVFYQNDDFGEEGYISLLESLKKKKIKLVAEGSYKRNTLSINHAFNEIKEAKPDAIILIGANKANALFIKKARNNNNLKETIFCNISFGNANAMIKSLDELKIETHHLIFSQVVPNYEDNTKPIINEYQKIMKKYYPKEELGFISLEAFLAAKVLVHAILKIEGNVTREKLSKNLKVPLSNLLEGIKLKYINSQLLNKTYLFYYENSQFKEIKND